MSINLKGIPDFDKFERIKTGSTQVSSDGSTVNWTTVAHNLGYRPIVNAELNNVGISSIVNNGDISLPTWTQASIDSTNHQIIFSTWLFTASDTTNAYFILFNSTGSPISAYTIKYDLLRFKSK